MRRTPPSTISVPYLDTHRIMSPSPLSTANYYDNQCTSLFGDPVPPPPDSFFEDLEKNLYGSLRARSSSIRSNSIVDDFPKANSFSPAAERNSIAGSNRRTPSSRLSRRDSEDPPPGIMFPATYDHRESISPTEDISYQAGNPLHRNGYDLPTNGLSRPQLVISPPSQEYDPDDLWGSNIISRNRRRSSEISIDARSDLDTIRSPPKFDTRNKSLFSKESLHCRRQASNESFSSGEWFKPSNDYEEWAKIPKLRPSSKNVMSINQEPGNHQGSPLASLIQGSNTSTSSDEKISPDRQLNGFADDTPLLIISQEDVDESPPKELPPPEVATIPKELPLPIVTNAVTTGSNFRANAPRAKKKPSFTIIAERSPQSSRPTSPSPGNSGRVSPFLGYGFKETSRPTSQRKKKQSPPVQLPKIAADANNNMNTSEDTARPLVQFNMSSQSGPFQNLSTGKGILQQRTTHPAPKPPERKKKKNQAVQSVKKKPLPKVHSFESLPRIVTNSDPKLPPRRLNKTSIEFGIQKNSLPLPSKNPTSKQRGLLRVFSVENSPSRIPVRADGAASMENLTSNHRSSLSPIRKDSTSSERRSSSLTAPRSSITSDRRSSNLSTVTTSDFSFRRSSISPPKNGIDLGIRSPRSPRRVAKPTTLSPIIGTPNKDAQLSTDEQFPSVSQSRRGSQSRIPVNGSKTPSRSNSRGGSRNHSRTPSIVNSRAPSPNKEFSPGKDFLPFSRPNSRVSSRPTSRTSSRIDLISVSRAPSRSNSRASTSSRMDQTTRKASSLSPPKSRRDSLVSKKSRSQSPEKPTRRSMSPRLSPTALRTRSVSRTDHFSPDHMSPLRMKSPSPIKTLSPTKSPTPPKSKPAPIRLSRLPSKKETAASAKKSSNSLKKPEINVRRSSSVARSTSVRRELTNAKKPPTGSKKDASTLKTPKNVRRETSSLNRETGNLKRESSNLRRETSNLKKESVKVKRDPLNVKRDVSNTRKPVSTLKKDGPVGSKKESANVQKGGVKNLKKEPSSIKRTPSNLKREGSNIKREPSNLKRETSSLKRQSSNLQRETSNLKREPSNLKREPSNLKREPSNLKRDSSPLKREPSNLKREGSRVSLKKSASNPKMDTGPKVSLAKKRSDSSLSKLEKKGSFRNEKTSSAMAEESDASTVPVDSLREDTGVEDSKGDKLIPLTKANVISMTTAAITAQPVQITTSITNQIPLTKSNSSGQLLGTGDFSAAKQDMKDMDPVSILEKSQKTLETVQKTVADATEEIQKTINENLTDLKTLESDMGRISEEPAPFEKSDSLTTVLENPIGTVPTAEASAASKPSAALSANTGVESKHDSTAKPSPAPPTQPIEANVSVLTTKKSTDNLLHPNTNHNNNNNDSSMGSTANGAGDGAQDMAERVSERAISVLPEVECESANLQNYELRSGEDNQKNSTSSSNNNNDEGLVMGTSMGTGKDQAGAADARDGNGGKTEGNDGNKHDDSQEYLDDEKPKGCCSRFCSKLCMPCRRCRCCSCCKKSKPGSAKSDERIIVEEVNEKRGCWGSCCSCCRKKKNIEPQMMQRRMDPIQEERESGSSSESKKQNKCFLCLGKVFCCRKTNKVETITGDAEEVRKCCFCIPCGKKKQQANAWEDRRESIISEPPPPQGCCSRLCSKIFCCCRRQPKPVSESRRTSMNSKSKAPTIPLEDNRPKLHNDLVEYNSKMKGAIPVMPLWIAWFCMICNCLVPGLGTILSGVFCICVGIPRFSQYDSAKARIGSLFINCIVGVAQAFCVMFCLVGWGWSIWWGTIMLKTARKLKKIRRVEELEMQEEQRQQAAERARLEKDVEAGKKSDKK